MTSTNGASSSSRAAWRKGRRNSSPPSVGERTLLCRWTFGIPGIAPSSTSSIPGWPAAVIDTESPSQLIPSEIHRIWTSSTPVARGSAVMRDLLLVHVQRFDPQFLAGDHLDVPGTARPAREREAVQPAHLVTAPAAARRRHLLEHELGTVERRVLRDELEGELERIRHDLPQVPDGDLHPGHAPAAGVTLCDGDDRLGDGELVHQQIRGSGSPTSWSMTRRPPKLVSTKTIPCGSVRTSPISAAASQPTTALIASSAASAASGATKATSFPSFATYIGSMPKISAAPATEGGTGTAASRTSIATVDARASSFRTDATPPRVASRRQ